MNKALWPFLRCVPTGVRPFPATWRIVVLLSCAAFGSPAIAQLSVFQTAMFAQLHCPTDKVVWLDLTKRRYYSEGQRLYGKGRGGLYVCRGEARKSGYKRSLLGRR